MTAIATRRGPTRGRHVKVNTMALRTVLRFSGMTQGQLARKAGLTQPAISYLVSGARDTCKPETAAAIIKALGITRRDRDEIFHLVLTGD